MSSPALDPRINAYRDDLAAETLRRQVEAPRFVAGEVRQVVHPATPLRARPDPRDGWTTEVLFGELVTVYDEKDGWAWAQLARDAYVGYLRSSTLSAQVRQVTHRVRALGTFLYSTPDIKTPPWMQLSMNAALSVAESGATFARMEDGSFVPTRHIAEYGRYPSDFVTIAERFLNVPYLWGGKSRLGVDCSGLLQVAMHAAGLACPRDSDMQLAEIGEEVENGNGLDGLMRGDIVFWKGHVGIMLDAFLLLHANAHHMAVVVEPVSTAVDRIARAGSNVLAVKRLAVRVAT